MLSIRSMRVATLGLALLAPALAAASGDVTENAVALPAGAFGWLLRQLTPVDLDGDGLLDLVVSGSRAIVWRQVPDGTLTPCVPSVLSGRAVVLDLDADGQLSIVCPNLVLGLRAQEFVAPFVLGPETVLASESDMGGLVVFVAGDLDGDGQDDILGDGFSQPGLRAWLGDGTGGLLPSVQASDVTAPLTELGDLDLDGTLDVLAGSAAGGLVPLLGQGDGTFIAQPAIPLPGIPNFSEIALGHLNSDGLLDAAVGSVSGTQLLFGTGGGGQAPWMIAPGSARAVDLGDADGDGDDDLVAGSMFQCTVQLIDAGGLGAAGSFITEASLWDVALAPLHPGEPPTVLAARVAGTEGDVILAACGADGLPTLEQQFANAPSSAPLALADIDADGQDELVALQTLENEIVVHEIPGDGTIGPASAGTPIAPNAYLVSVRPMPLDGDAFEDLLILSVVNGGSGGLWEPWLSNGNGTFTPGTPIYQLPSGGSSDAVGDVDGDGDEDLLIATAIASAGSIIWLANLGDGTFGPAVPATMPGVLPVTPISLADADEDGLADAFAMTGTFPGIITWWKGTGDGGFISPQVLLTGPQKQFSLIATDLDGDGHVDLAAHGQPAFADPFSALLTVLHGQGNGAFDAPRLFPAGLSASGDPLATADFDRDGRVDVLLVDGASLRTLLLPQAADGSFGEVRPLAFEVPLAQNNRSLTADVDGDGDEDFLSYASILPGDPNPLRVGWVNVQPGALDLGHALIGSSGTPVLTGGGLMQPTQAVHIDLAAVPPATPLLLMLGLETSYQPVAGGTLVPLAQVVLGGFLSSPTGSFHLQSRWPADAPAGLAVYAQVWCKDPLTGAAVASNALQFEGE